MKAPRFVIAGERSGVGKSTITVGILLSLKARGLDPQPFKTGPDFLDPMHHSIVLGKPSRNLDTWMFGPRVKDTFARGAKGSGISVIEGVMGLFDGDGGRREEGSTAHLSKVLNAPVVLIVNAANTARSAGAIALGFKNYDPDVNIAGVIFNNVSSKRHLGMLEDSLRGMESLGGIPAVKDVRLASRHLGLVPAGETYDADRYERIRLMIEENLNMDRLIEIARSVPDMEEAEAPVMKGRPRARIGVAQDKAFNFYYYDNFDILRGFGAEIVPFSPMYDDLPDVDGLYFGGGYPETYAQQLQDNSSMRRKVRERAYEGMPIYAECGGMMYACDRVRDFDGRTYSMTSIFDPEVEMTDKLQAVGYVEAEAERENVLCGKGWTTRGHEFHYSRVLGSGEKEYAYSLKRGKGIAGNKDGLIAHNTMASYLHLHFASCPQFAERFVGSCADHARR